MSKNWETHKMSLRQWDQTWTRLEPFLATSWWACVTTCALPAADSREPWHWVCVDAYRDKTGWLRDLLLLGQKDDDGEEVELRA